MFKKKKLFIYTFFLNTKHFFLKYFFNKCKKGVLNQTKYSIVKEYRTFEYLERRGIEY